MDKSNKTNRGMYFVQHIFIFIITLGDRREKIFLESSLIVFKTVDFPLEKRIKVN